MPLGQQLEHNLVLQGSKTLIKADIASLRCSHREAMAILVGFSWEQAFEGCVTKTCERTKPLRSLFAKQRA